MKDFQLRLNSPPGGIYFPGMTVTGTLLVETDKPKNYRSIQVKLIGFAKVKWTKTSGVGEHSTTETYSSREDYINASVTVWSQGTSSESDTLPAGTYQFPFSFQLVGNQYSSVSWRPIPSSYADKVGEIKYIVEARVVNRGFLKKDHIHRSEILVKGWIDVNRPDFLKQKSVEVQGTLCCWCCESEPIIIRVNIPRIGYYIQQGNSIPVTVSVENQTDRRIEGETLTLRKKVNYSTYSDDHSKKLNLDRIKSLPIPAYSTRETQHLLPISYTHPSLMNCNIIELGYYVKIQAASQTIEIPVVLGFPQPDAVSGLLPPQYGKSLGVITRQPVS